MIITALFGGGKMMRRMQQDVFAVISVEFYKLELFQTSATF
jgi:hypothetical protein